MQRSSRSNPYSALRYLPGDLEVTLTHLLRHESSSSPALAAGLKLPTELAGAENSFLLGVRYFAKQTL
jgi:hypothetical protein